MHKPQAGIARHISKAKKGAIQPGMSSELGLDAALYADGFVQSDCILLALLLLSD